MSKVRVLKRHGRVYYLQFDQKCFHLREDMAEFTLYNMKQTEPLKLSPECL